MARYAIYAAPERGTRLWQFGNLVLGRDAETGEEVAQKVPPQFSPEEWTAFTASPRRYGFHATLKAPFALHDGATEDQLFAAVLRFAAARTAIHDIPLEPELSGRFVFLTPAYAEPRVLELANACVAEFDSFRAPLADDDRAKRVASGLSERQTEHLDRWGYPYVFEDFMFHLTLAGPLPEGKRDAVFAALADAFAREAGGEALDVRTLCIFREPAPGAPFSLVLRAPLGEAA